MLPSIKLREAGEEGGQRERAAGSEQRGKTAHTAGDLLLSQSRGDLHGLRSGCFQLPSSGLLSSAIMVPNCAVSLRQKSLQSQFDDEINNDL